MLSFRHRSFLPLALRDIMTSPGGSQTSLRTSLLRLHRSIFEFDLPRSNLEAGQGLSESLLAYAPLRPPNGGIK